jgi:anti-anti-sigma regulatory factor
VLRISQESGDNNNQILLRLEGRVVGPWVDELARTCAAARRSGAGVVLDLSGVSFLDGDAVRLVVHLLRSGMVLKGCSAFVHEQLEGEDHDSDRAI